MIWYYAAFFTVRSVFFFYIYLHYIAYCIYTCVSTHVVKRCYTWHRLWFFFFLIYQYFIMGTSWLHIAIHIRWNYKKILFKVVIYRFVRLVLIFYCEIQKDLKVCLDSRARVNVHIFRCWLEMEIQWILLTTYRSYCNDFVTCFYDIENL